MSERKDYGHQYIVYWPDGFNVQFTAAKYLSLAELRFMVHLRIIALQSPHNDEGFVRVDCALDPRYWTRG